jgi:hypothetical protein
MPSHVLGEGAFRLIDRLTYGTPQNVYLFVNYLRE